MNGLTAVVEIKCQPNAKDAKRRAEYLYKRKDVKRRKVQAMGDLSDVGRPETMFAGFASERPEVRDHIIPMPGMLPLLNK